MTSRKWSSLVGGLVGVVGLGFVVRLMWQQRDDLASTLHRAEPGWLVLALCVGVAGMSVIGWCWMLLVRVLGDDIGLVSAERGYFVGQLGKYVPGGLWAVLGRGEWARREGVAGAVAYSSTMLSMGTAYVAGSLAAGVTMVVARPPGEVGWLTVAVVALGPVGLLALHPAIFGRVTGLARRVSGRELAIEVPSWGASVGVVVRQLAAWVGIGTATWLVGVAIGADVSWPAVVVATCVAWVAGFLFLPVPGGIGIREAAFVAVLGGSPVAATIALAARLLFIVVDVVGASGASWLQAAARRRNPGDAGGGTTQSGAPADSTSGGAAASADRREP